MHSHGPDFLRTAHNGGKGETQGIRTTIFGHLGPIAAAMGQCAIVDKDSGAARVHDGGTRAHHVQCPLTRTSRSGQSNIHGIAVDDRQLVNRCRLPT